MQIAYPSAGTQTASYNTFNALTNFSGQAFSYDADGNLPADGQRNYSWNTMTLHRFWFKSSSIKPYNSLRLGCGVTAYDYDDAVSILRKTVFAGQDFPEIESCITDVDVSALDQKHVIPNMEPPVWRGVWFPRGYSLL